MNSTSSLIVTRDLLESIENILGARHQLVEFEFLEILGEKEDVERYFQANCFDIYVVLALYDEVKDSVGVIIAFVMSVRNV